MRSTFHGNYPRRQCPKPCPRAAGSGSTIDTGSHTGGAYAGSSSAQLPPRGHRHPNSSKYQTGGVFRSRCVNRLYEEARLARTRAREGLPYTGSVVAGIVQNDADKILLVRHGLTVDAGHYSVAYRLS